MKRTKKVTVLLCILLCMSMILAACGPKEQPTNPSSESGDTQHTVTVKTAGDMVLNGITVYIYGDDTLKDLVCFGTLDKEGKYTFTAKTSSDYVAVLEGAPEGYEVAKNYTLSGTDTEIKLTSTVISGANPTEKVYKNGDVMRDFTITDIDGVEFTLSELLKEKKAVVLNFWATDSEACMQELPLLQDAYEDYKDSIALIAMNPVDTDDAAIAELKETLGLTMPVAKCDSSWAEAMSPDCPTTVIIDRYGVICLKQTGAVSEAEMFETAFEYFTADEYKQKLVGKMEDLMGEAPVGSSRNPAVLEPEMGKFETVVAPNGKYFNCVYRANNLTVRIENADVYVVCNGMRFDPNPAGIIEFKLFSPDSFTPGVFEIHNSTDKEVTVSGTFVSFKNPMENPMVVQTGEINIEVEEGNPMGHYFKFVAEKDGKLVLTIKDAPKDIVFEAVLFNLTSQKTTSSLYDATTDANGDMVITIDVKSGEEVQINFRAEPNEETQEIPALITRALLSIMEGEGSGSSGDASKEVEYTITILDNKGNPVQNVKVEISVDGKLVKLTSDHRGVISKKLIPDTYSVELKLPVGYQGNTRYILTANNHNLKITLVKEVTYTVTVVDQNMKPIPGVKVSIGDVNVTTNKRGAAKFTLQQGEYTAVITVPEGYQAETVSCEFKDKTDLTVQLKSESPIEKIEYYVTVVDFDNRPQKNVEVQFYIDGNEIGKPYKVNEKGMVIASLEKGNYTVKLICSGIELGYDQDSSKLSPENSSVLIETAPLVSGKPLPLKIGDMVHDAYSLTIGGNYAYIKANGLTYFVFAPAEAGTYQITTSNPEVRVENWNKTDKIQNITDSSNIKDNVLTLELDVVDLESVEIYVIGMHTDVDVSEIIIKITKVSNTDAT